MRKGTYYKGGVSLIQDYTKTTNSWYSDLQIVAANIDSIDHANLIKGDFRSPNSWGYSSTRGIYSNGFFRQDFSNGNIHLETGFIRNGGIPTQPTVDYTSDYNQALNRAYNKIYGDLNVSVDIAEWKQARSMFNAVEQAEALFRRKANLLRKAGSLWLQYAYGWRPLAQTIWGTAYELQNRLLDRVTIAEGRSTTRTPVRTVSNSTYWTTSTTGFVSTRSLVKIRYKEDGIPAITRWTSLNPASIAWELTPYSFVVDWFYNIGGYMQDFERALMLNRAFRDGFVTNSSLSELEVESVHTGVVPDSRYRAVSGHIYNSATWKTSSRVKLAAPPLPRSPVLNTHLGSGRLLNAASLLSQFLGRR